MAKRSFENLEWLEVHIQRPYELDQLINTLINVATLSPRGAVIWESRSHGGYVKHLLGADSKYLTRIKNVFKTYADVQFYPLEDFHRLPMNNARQLSVSRPGLTLNTDAISATIRSGLAALAAVRGEEESVVQIVIGKAFKPRTTAKHLPDPGQSWISVILYDGSFRHIVFKSIFKKYFR